MAVAAALAGCGGDAPPPPQRLVDLGQGWSQGAPAQPGGWIHADAERLHGLSQGTRILPTAWLVSLEQGFLASEPLLAAANMRRLGFIVDDLGPDGTVRELTVPVGFASGTIAPFAPGGPPVDWMGFTCAACHTGQLDHEGQALRVEGGQAHHDAGAFQSEMAKAIIATGLLPWKYRRFKAKAVAAGYPADRLDADFETAYDAAWTGVWMDLTGQDKLYPTPEGHGRLDALQRIANQLFAEDLREAANNRPGEAPVSFPPLWDMWLFDRVQYNASVRQPMVRNMGEALGVRAFTSFVGADGAPNPEPQRWETSIAVRNIDWIERRYQMLPPPRWDEAVLGPLDREKVAAGRRLFEQRCAECHAVQAVIDRPLVRPDDGTEFREWHVKVVPLEGIATDPEAATAFARNRYDASKLGAKEPIGAADGLKLVTTGVKAAAYRREGILTAEEAAAVDGFGRENEVVAACGYKARPLVGIWATPPFLHNGSVRTLEDLLSEERPPRFAFGSREFDPVAVGYLDAGSATFDTALTGNDHAGHWFTDDMARPGRLGPALTGTEKGALIEYLKAATFDDYPMHTIRAAEVPPLPCSDRPRWAESETPTDDVRMLARSR